MAAPGERPAALALRHEVFCVEQGVPPDLEQDPLDDVALHLVACEGGDLVGTCRLIREGRAWRLGRMAVRADRRGGGVGRALLDAAHAEARSGGAQVMLLHAQTHALGFYAGAGYVARGPEFMDAGIPHREMTLLL